MKKNNSRIRLLVSVTILIVLFLIVTLIYWRVNLVKINQEFENEKEYKYHYALISDSKDSAFWKNVYEGAQEFASKNDAYVELMGENLAVNYSSAQLAEIAIMSGVDGIIIEGLGTDEQESIIEKASDKNIPVITMVNDCPNSKRISFVGLGNYNLGREYARAVIRTNNNDISKIYIFGEAKRANDNLLTNGFMETLQNEGNHFEVTTEFVPFEEQGGFFSFEQIREILLDEEKAPDVIVCVNEDITLTTYQALVDYNMVGKVKLIGYYSSDTILGAISKGGVEATIILDAAGMGRSAVKALNEYKQYNRVSDYITTEAQLIIKSNVQEYMKNEKDN